MKKVDLTGMLFGRFRVLSEADRSKSGHVMWACVCQCGTVKTVSGAALRSGNTQSCGCQKNESASQRLTKHGMSKSPLYAVWSTMKDRCLNEKSSDYGLYGGRGITVCERWMSFENFAADMGDRPHGTSIDRIDNSKGYEPRNCRWATTKDQARNKRNSRFLTLHGETLTVAEWAERVGINPDCIHQRLSRGMSDEDALSNRHGKRKYVTNNGDELSLDEWSARTGIRKSTIRERLRAGWDIKSALSSKPRTYKGVTQCAYSP